MVSKKPLFDGIKCVANVAMFHRYRWGYRGSRFVDEWQTIRCIDNCSNLPQPQYMLPKKLIFISNFKYVENTRACDKLRLGSDEGVLRRQSKAFEL
jgi:hypothetical protein